GPDWLLMTGSLLEMRFDLRGFRFCFSMLWTAATLLTLTLMVNLAMGRGAMTVVAHLLEMVTTVSRMRVACPLFAIALGLGDVVMSRFVKLRVPCGSDLFSSLFVGAASGVANKRAGEMCKWVRDFMHDVFAEDESRLTPASLAYSGNLEDQCIPLASAACLMRPAKSSISTCKLLREPTSHSAAARNDLLFVRDFEEAAGREWPYLPADDPYALQEIADQFDEEGQAQVEGAADFVACLLTPEYVPEVVLVSLAPPVAIEVALAAIQESRDAVRDRLFPVMLAVVPQPSQSYGLFLALPGWAISELVVCFDLSEVDGRVFADGAPASASKGTLLNIAGLQDDAGYDVYMGASPTPLQDDDEADLWQGLCIFVVPRHTLPGPYFRLEDTLLTSAAWEESPQVPMEDTVRWARKGTAAYLLLTTRLSLTSLRSRPGVDYALHCASSSWYVASLSLVAGKERLFGLTAAYALTQSAIPTVTDVMIKGYYCRNVFAVSDSTDPTTLQRVSRLVIALVDCRALMQGWQMLSSVDGAVPKQPFEDFLSTFVPPGWCLHLEGIHGEGDAYRIIPGQVVYASFVPIPVRTEGPSDQAESESLSDGSQADSTAGEASSTDSLHDHSRRRSRSRPPYREHGGSPSDGNVAACAPFLIFGLEYAPEEVLISLPAAPCVDSVLALVQAGRESAARARFPVLVPVFPQSLGSAALVVAQPSWCDQPHALFDCSYVTGAIFSAIVSPVMDRASLLAVAGLSHISDLEVYVPELDVPMSEHATCRLSTGACVAFTPSSCPHVVVSSLDDMTLSSDGWDPTAPRPSVRGPWLHLLTDTGLRAVRSFCSARFLQHSVFRVLPCLFRWPTLRLRTILMRAVSPGTLVLHNKFPRRVHPHSLAWSWWIFGPSYAV
ncbi:unnamed protein product, partial [Symbiodinium sp. CCMP2456]